MSAFYDLASLVLVPSGYKASKVYAQKPLTTDGQLTFSRASTATRVNSAGLIETVNSNVPRLDYLASTCPKLLLEPQRTNTAKYSQDFTDAVWQGSGATVVANQAVSPDGTTTADLIYPTVSGNFAGKYQNLLGATTGVVSCYVKQAGKRFAQLGTDNNASYTCAFDLQLGTVVRTATNYTGTITSLGNGWYRITAAYVSSAAQAYPFIGVSDNAAGSGTVDGTNGLYVWGFQYEVSASYATSYLKTEALSVTRLADACSKTGISSLIGQTEGTLFFDVTLDQRANYTYFAIAPNIASAAVYIGIAMEATRINAEIVNSGIQAGIAFTNSSTGRFKAALAYKANDVAFYVNGTLVGTDTNATIPACSELALNNYNREAAPKYNQAILFKTRLPNAQLAELTAL